MNILSGLLATLAGRGIPGKSEEPYRETILDRDSVKVAMRCAEPCCWEVVRTLGDGEWVIDLEKEGVLQREPELSWANNDWVCILTWWSQAQSRYIFVPLGKDRNYVYIDKTIVQMDNINHNVVYVDDTEDRVLFTVENLDSRKTVSTSSVVIGQDNHVFPFVDRVDMSRKRVEIFTGSEKLSVDIENIY